MNTRPRPLVMTRVVIKQGIRRVNPYAPKVIENAVYSCVPTIIDDAINHTHTDLLHTTLLTLSSDILKHLF